FLLSSAVSLRPHLPPPTRRSSDLAAEAYLLLAAALGRERRAGIAGFVLHGRVRQLAVTAAGYGLHAFTLRAPSTLRTPAELGVADRESTRLNPVTFRSRMPSSA